MTFVVRKPAQPPEVVTVAFSVRVPVEPAVKLTLVPVVAPVNVPLVIVHWYVAPATAATEAVPLAPAVTEAAVVMLTTGVVWAVTTIGSE